MGNIAGTSRVANTDHSCLVKRGAFFVLGRGSGLLLFLLLPLLLPLTLYLLRLHIPILYLISSLLPCPKFLPCLCPLALNLFRLLPLPLKLLLLCLCLISKQIANWKNMISVTMFKLIVIADLQISKSPMGPTKNLERHYNRVVVWSFVRLVATLGPTGYNSLIPF